MQKSKLSIISKNINNNSFQTIVLTIIIIFFIAQNIYSQNVEQYTVNKIEREIIIDGYLNENDWNEAEPTKYFVLLGDNLTDAKTNTWAKMLWDETFFYVAFYCEDPKIWATYKNQDDPLYKEDVVEVYIDPDGDGENYIEVEINPINTVFDLWLTKPRKQGGDSDVSWTLNGLRSAISVKGTISNNSDIDSSWICEMALPFSEMKFSAATMNFPPLANDNWRFNIYRFDRSSTTNSAGEATGWSQTEGGQHEPDKFGKIKFGDIISNVIEYPEKNNLGNNFHLKQNSSNLFNRSTLITFSTLKISHVSLKIFNLLGQQVKTLINKVVPSGMESIPWNETNEYGKNMPNGVYLFQLQSDLGDKTMKMVMLR